MRFVVRNIYLWFGQDSVPKSKILNFEENKVNVVRGDATTGKSTLFSIIDYCLVSEKMNIVDTNINENIDWYGLEFSIGYKNFAIARKAQRAELPTDSVYLIEENFPQNFYPSNTNKQVNDARRILENAFGYSSSSNVGYWHYRRNLCLNYLAESIIASDHEYLHLSFFEEEKIGDDIYEDLRSSLMAGKQKELEIIKKTIEGLKNKQKAAEKYGKVKEELDKKEEACRQSLRIGAKYGLIKEIANGTTLADQLSSLNDSLQSFVKDWSNNSNSNDVERLKDEISRMEIQLQNMTTANSNYQKYYELRTEQMNSLLPVETIQQELRKKGFTGSPWYDFIIKSLIESLRAIKQDVGENNGTSLFDESEIKRLRVDLDKKHEEISKLLMVNSSLFNNSEGLFEIIKLSERLPSMMDEYKKALRKVEKNSNVVFNDDDIENLKELGTKEQDINIRPVRDRIEEICQEIFDSFEHIGIGRDYHVNFDINNFRMKLRDRKTDALLNVLGSQANYMFLHICFYLSIHQYLAEQDTNQIGSFLFIDQPSVPFFMSGSNNLSDDECKLMDVFRSIENFIRHTLKDLKKDFQIILIEHADKRMWEETDELKHFVTMHEFTNGNALIPQSIIDKKNNG